MISFAGSQQAGLSIDDFSGLNKASMGATLAKHMPYLVGKESSKVSKLRMVTIWLVADLETKAGRAAVRAAVSHVKSTNQMRLAVVHNSPNPGLISRASEAALRNLGGSAANALLTKILKEDTATKPAGVQKNKISHTSYSS